MALELFHIHTYRCKHAGTERDEQYIQKAIEMNATSITFTDHAPFPENPFGNRMMIEELPEYVETLKELRDKYIDEIDVKIGLEIEYLPSFENYYKWLKQSDWFDILMIGQHFYEYDKGRYSFVLGKGVLDAEEYKGIARAIMQGADTGYFNIIAHPDRMFRKCKEWTPEMENISRDVIQVALDKSITLEQNLSSMERSNQYWLQFWNMVPDNAKLITGIDAHSVKELEKIRER